MREARRRGRATLRWALALGLLGPAAAAQPVAPPVVLTFAPADGATASYRVMRALEERSGGQPAPALEAEAALDVRAAAPEGASVQVTWTYSAVEVQAPAAKVGPALAAASAFGMADGLAVTFSLDDDGHPARLVNGADVRRQLRRLIRADEARPGAFADLEAVALREGLRRRIAQPEALADLALSGPRLLHLVAGERLEAGRTRTTTGERESPLTRGAVRSTVRVSLDSLSAERDVAVVAWEARADRDALVASIRALLDATAPGEVDPTLIADLAPTLALEERARYTVATAHGWVREATYERTARAAGQERIERARFAGGPRSEAD